MIFPIAAFVLFEKTLNEQLNKNNNRANTTPKLAAVVASIAMEMSFVRIPAYSVPAMKSIKREPHQVSFQILFSLYDALLRKLFTF